MKRIKENGFSLVEVLVASLIIVLGVTGYVSLQSEYVIADRNLNLRSVASQLASDKIRDLHYFQGLLKTASSESYSDIANNLGGDIAAGPIKVVLSLNKGDDHSFNLNWLVQDYYFVDSDFDGIADTWVTTGELLMPKVLPLYSNMKKVTVSVLWTNIEGEAETLSVSTNIAPIIQSNSFHVLYREASIKAVP